MTNNTEHLPATIDPFQIMDRLDDELIIKEMEGRLPDVLTYHFKDKEQEIWGLSKAGVDECKTELAKKGEVIRELEMEWQDGEGEAYFHTRVGRYIISKEGQEILLDTAMGFKRQSKSLPNSDRVNPFWYEQGAIKACRNACLRLIPKTIQEAVIEYAKRGGKVKTINERNHKEEKAPVMPQYGTDDKVFTGNPVPKKYWTLRKTDKAAAQKMIGGEGYGVAKHPKTGKWEIVQYGEAKDHKVHLCPNKDMEVHEDYCNRDCSERKGCPMFEDDIPV